MFVKRKAQEITDLQTAIAEHEENESKKRKTAPKIKTVLQAYYETDDIEKKNRLLKSVLEKATFLRKKEWKKRDQFEIHLFPRI